MNRTRVLLLLAIAALLVALFAAGLDRLFTLEEIKARQAQMTELFARNPFAVAAAFFAVYVAVTGLSLPGAALMTLLAGAVFGLAWGTVIVSFASSIGATLAFLASRYLFHDLVQRRFGPRLAALNRGVRTDGAFYLLTLRLVPAFPFFLVNLAMALTPMRTRTYHWVSQAGMLPATVVYVNVGTQLAKIDSLAGIVSPGMVASFVLLTVLPLAAKRVVHLLAGRRARAAGHTGGDDGDGSPGARS